jgi:enediyne biosynthesis protein E4
MSRRIVVALVLTAAGGAVARVPAAAPDSVRPAAPIFREVAQETGLRFTHEPGADGQFRLPEIIGSGAALLDYDTDGDLDVYLVQGSPAARTSSRLFRNGLIEDRRLHFTDVTEQAGLVRSGWGMGAAVGDYDNDGDPDLYVTSFGSNALYRNDGRGTFTNVTAEAGVDDPRWSTSAAFVDYDADGNLDLFVAAYVDFSEKSNKPCYDPAGQRDYCLPAEYRPQPARLFRNDGRGRFADVTGPTGIGSAAGPGLGVVATDANGDGLLDLYVANDGTANHLWMNTGTGRFTEEGLLSGTAYDAAGRAEAGMGLAAADFDTDGDEDLFVTNLIGETNTLYLNDGKGLFEDATVRLKLAAVSRPFTGFGAGWVDIDNDSRLDLFIANGAVAIVDALRGRRYPYQQRNLLLRNDGAAGFHDLTEEAGPALALEEVSRGAAFGDLDNDGDVDIVVSNNDGPVRVLLNEAPPRHWLAIRLEGTTAARDGQGALVRVRRRGAPDLLRRAHTDGSYLSASDSRVHVGLGEAASIEGLVVEWRHGDREEWPAMPVDRLITLRQGSGRQPREQALPAAARSPLRLGAIDAGRATR